MEAESLPSLSSLFHGVDQWGEVLLVLPLLVVLEAVLSADNAIALAAISRRLHDPRLQRQALNLGLLLALVLRLGLIVAARWVLTFKPLQLLAAAYLLWLCASQLLSRSDKESTDDPATVPSSDANPSNSAIPAWRGLLGVVLTLGLTDLAFSLDSVAAAVAVTDQLLLVMAGGVIGVVALRLTAELFIRWLEDYRHLESAGYLAVALVGLRLLLRVLVPALVVPEWVVLLSVVGLFLWGFSARREDSDSVVDPSADRMPAVSDKALPASAGTIAPTLKTVSSHSETAASLPDQGR